MTSCKINPAMRKFLGSVGIVFYLWQAVALVFAAPAPSPANKRDEAARLLARFDNLRSDYRRRHETTWRNAQAAGLLGELAVGDGLPGLALSLALFRQRRSIGEAEFLLRQDDGPRELLLSALHAARTAIQADPKDTQAHLLLGQAYMRLAYNTGERVTRRQLPMLNRLRQVQIAATLQRAIALQPDSLSAHAGLVDLYREMNYLDLTAKHLRRVLERSRADAPNKDETREQFKRRIEQLRTALDQLEKYVLRRSNHYEVSTAGKSVGDKAMRAMQLGLAGKALEVLLASDVTAFGTAGAKLKVDLMLSTGRVKEVGEWLTPDVGEAIDMGIYHWFRSLYGAAVGDYDEADKHLLKIIAQSERLDLRMQLAVIFGQLVLDGWRRRESPTQLIQMSLQQRVFQHRLEEVFRVLRQRADLFVLRGILAMERGRDREAARHFREALRLWSNDAAVSSSSGLDFAGRTLAQRCLRLLER